MKFWQESAFFIRISLYERYIFNFHCDVSLKTDFKMLCLQHEQILWRNKRFYCFDLVYFVEEMGQRRKQNAHPLFLAQPFTSFLVKSHQSLC